MSKGLLIQYIVLGLIVAISVLVLLRKLAPALTNRWLASASIRFSRPDRSAWVRALGRRLQPKQAIGSCSDGCSTCGGCGPKQSADAKAAARPLEFRPRDR